MKISLKLLLYIIIPLLVGACNASQKIGIEESVSNVQSPQILSMVFEIHKSGNVKIENTILAKGQLRKKKDSEDYTKEGDLVISFLNANKDTCTTFSLENPLRKKVEYSENLKEFKAETIELESASFSIRVQFQNCFKYIVVEEIENATNNKKHKLLESPLNLNFYD